LDIDPNYAYAHLNYGILLDLYLGELENALAHYQKFQQLTPEEDKEVTKWIVDLERRIERAN
jgi:lipoprotein NlpI